MGHGQAFWLDDEGNEVLVQRHSICAAVTILVQCVTKYREVLSGVRVMLHIVSYFAVSDQACKSCCPDAGY